MGNRTASPLFLVRQAQLCLLFGVQKSTHFRLLENIQGFAFCAKGFKMKSAAC